MGRIHNIKFVKSAIILTMLFVSGNYMANAYTQTGSKIPEQLITTYTGVLSAAGSITSVNTEATCTIKTKGYRTYAFYFSDGVKPITGVKFIKNDDTYTSTAIYRGKTLAITVDEEGDLVIGATGLGAISFSGSINNHVHLGTGNTSIHIDDNQTNIATEDASIHTNQGSISIGTGTNGIQIENGTISVHNESADITINSNQSSCIVAHDHNYGVLIGCSSKEISSLPRNVMGIYRGKLSTYDIETRKGICTIVKTACKTYRLDFSNGIPSIHNIQFGRKNDFDEYTSVIIEGEYSSAIEIDVTFNDLEIDGKILRVDFDGKKN